MKHAEIFFRVCYNPFFKPFGFIPAYTQDAASLYREAVFLCQFSNGVFGKDDPRTSNAKSIICPSECVPNIEMPVNILIRKGKELSPPVRAFIDLIRESYGSLTR